MAPRSEGAAVRELCLPAGPLTLDSAARLEREALELGEDREARVVVLRSAGPDFCPGPAADLDPLRCGHDPAAALAAIRCPTVAAIDGRAESVGLELALACDLRVATAAASLGFPDLADGRLPCWGGTQRLVRLAGLSAAFGVLYGEPLDGEAAAAVGLVQELAAPGELEATVEGLVATLLELAPLALELVKEALWRGQEMSMRGGLELEGDLNHLLQGTADRAEGIAAFLEKRQARFEGR